MSRRDRAPAPPAQSGSGGRQAGARPKARDDRREDGEAPLPVGATPPGGFRAGFVSLIGRPNAGKSTLLNRLVGQKLAIVSPRPQTTRNRITGILHRPDAQIVFVDTPGLHTGGGKLGEFMLQTAQRAVEDVDVVCLVVDATDRAEPDDLVLAALRGYAGTTVCALNKIDRVQPKAALLPLLQRWQAAHPFRELVPISAADGTGCDRLLQIMLEALPEHPAFFPADATSDQPETFWVAEVVREQVFHFIHQEVPYAVAVRVEELTERPEPAGLYIRASIFVEQDSQKGILIGKGGAMLKRIGTEARRQLEAFFGIKVYLELHVQVRRNWRKDERALREFGFRLTS
jgi:GTP-binding protein Era